jgi:chorismate mutase / prephenate dehydratase
MTESIDPELKGLRERIEKIDQEVVALIAARVAAARDVGRIKQRRGLPILDPAREAAVVRRAVELARSHSLAEEDVREIYWHLIGLSRRAQLAGQAEEARL